MKHTNDRLLTSIYQNPKYKGKHVLIMGDEIRVLSTKSKKERATVLTDLVKKYPKEMPLITFVPKDDTLILII